MAYNTACSPETGKCNFAQGHRRKDIKNHRKINVHYKKQKKSNEKTLEEIKNLLPDHYQPKHLVMAKSYHFPRAKHEGESVDNFFCAIKTIAVQLGI